MSERTEDESEDINEAALSGITDAAMRAQNLTFREMNSAVKRAPDEIFAMIVSLRPVYNTLTILKRGCCGTYKLTGPMPERHHPEISDKPKPCDVVAIAIANLLIQICRTPFVCICIPNINFSWTG
jgi:hypothetical protein